jgi:carbon monoxide dehydrogenase subunit G
MARQHDTAGVYSMTCRRLAALAAAIAILGGAASAAAEPQVTVRAEHGVYVVAARFEVPQSPSAALAVLTDFERIPRFMPDLKTSIVRSRFADGAVVEQESVAHVLMFAKRVHVLLDVHVHDNLIRFKDACGRSFARYEGAWRLERRGAVTVVQYDLEAQPAFDVPAFLLTRLLKRDARAMIERLRTEIAARDDRR